MQKTDIKVATYSAMITSMQEEGLLAFTTKTPETTAMLGLKSVDSARQKDISRRDTTDNLMLLAYYRFLRLTHNPKYSGEWHARREGGVISRLLSETRGKDETPLYAMASFLLSDAAKLG